MAKSIRLRSPRYTLFLHERHTEPQHRENVAGEGGCERDERQLLQYWWAGDNEQVLRRERGETPRDLQRSTRERAIDHLHRRDRLDRAETRGGHWRGRETSSIATTFSDGRSTVTGQSGGYRCD